MKTEALDASGLDWLGGLTRALLAVAALLGGVWLYARIKSPFAYFGTTYDSRPLAAGFSATDQSGQPFEFASTRGEVVALFFGFTRCPDICPLTLNYLRKAKEQLPADVQDDLRIVFVSLDPERDTVAQLQAYTNFFGGGLTGLRLPEPQLAAVAKSYGVGYAKAPIQPKGASASSEREPREITPSTTRPPRTSSTVREKCAWYGTTRSCRNSTGSCAICGRF